MKSNHKMTQLCFYGSFCRQTQYNVITDTREMCRRYMEHRAEWSLTSPGEIRKTSLKRCALNLSCHVLCFYWCLASTTLKYQHSAVITMTFQARHLMQTKTCAKDRFAIFWAWYNYRNHEFIAAVITCTRPAQDLPCQQSVIGGAEVHGTIPLCIDQGSL